MLNLLDFLTDEDNIKIESYFKRYGVEDGYIGNNTYLQDWAKSKKSLFHLLGGQFIYKFPYTYEKDSNILRHEFDSLTNMPLFQKIYDDLWSILSKETTKKDPEDENMLNSSKIYYIRSIYSGSALLDDKINQTIKLKLSYRKNTLQLQSGMKPMKALQKLIQYMYEDKNDKIFEDFEKVRLKHSLIKNDKYLHGNICLSIHPLDFVTMSDNDEGWSSCMSWKEDGCYHLGTLEMMNSNVVICAYMESNNSVFVFDEINNLSWNNKKWRQLFYCTKDIIVSGKSYPYSNTDFTIAILEKLRALAKDNWNHTYKYGIEEYKDMDRVDGLYSMNKRKEWASERGNVKTHGIFFDTNLMYNDMLNDGNFVYYCIRNYVPHSKVINYSGKARCLCCNNSLLHEDWDSEGYNDRYDNTHTPICDRCLSNSICSICGSIGNLKNPVRVAFDGELYCKECWEECIKLCPDCGNAFNMKNIDGLFARVEDNIYLQDIVEDYEASCGFNGYKLFKEDSSIFEYCICSKCQQGKKTEKIRFERDPRRIYTSWLSLRTYLCLEDKFDYESEDLIKHRYKNLTTVEFPR